MQNNTEITCINCDRVSLSSSPDEPICSSCSIFLTYKERKKLLEDWVIELAYE